MTRTHGSGAQNMHGHVRTECRAGHDNEPIHSPVHRIRRSGYCSCSCSSFRTSLLVLFAVVQHVRSSTAAADIRIQNGTFVLSTLGRSRAAGVQQGRTEGGRITTHAMHMHACPRVLYILLLVISIVLVFFKKNTNAVCYQRLQITPSSVPNYNPSVCFRFSRYKMLTIYLDIVYIIK